MPTEGAWGESWLWGQDGIRRNRHNPAILPIPARQNCYEPVGSYHHAKDRRLSFRSRLPITSGVAEGWNNRVAVIVFYYRAGVDEPILSGGRMSQHNLTYDSFISYLSHECGLANNSVDAYRRDMRRFANWMDEAEVEDWSELSVRKLGEYIAYLANEKLSPSSVARHVTSLKIFFRF